MEIVVELGGVFKVCVDFGKKGGYDWMCEKLYMVELGYGLEEIRKGKITETEKFDIPLLVLLFFSCQSEDDA